MSDKISRRKFLSKSIGAAAIVTPVVGNALGLEDVKELWRKGKRHLPSVEDVWDGMTCSTEDFIEEGNELKKRVAATRRSVQSQEKGTFGYDLHRGTDDEVFRAIAKIYGLNSDLADYVDIMHKCGYHSSWLPFDQFKKKWPSVQVIMNTRDGVITVMNEKGNIVGEYDMPDDGGKGIYAGNATTDKGHLLSAAHVFEALKGKEDVYEGLQNQGIDVGRIKMKGKQVSTPYSFANNISDAQLSGRLAAIAALDPDADSFGKDKDGFPEGSKVDTGILLPVTKRMREAFDLDGKNIGELNMDYDGTFLLPVKNRALFRGDPRGESGGPLMTWWEGAWKQVGVVSHGGSVFGPYAIFCEGPRKIQKAIQEQKAFWNWKTPAITSRK